MESLQSSHFSSKYKDGKSNVVIDALLKRYSLLVTLDARFLGFEALKSYYVTDIGCCDLFLKSTGGPEGDFVLQEGFIFKCNRLCIPKHAIREMLVREAHGGGMAGHFGVTNTLDILKEHFYWPKILGDVTKIVNKYVTCQMSMSSFKSGLYSPLSVPNHPWEDVSWFASYSKGVRMQLW